MFIRDVHDLKITFSPAWTAVYSCVYVILNDFVTLDFLERVLRTQKFVDYVASLEKYKSGGYKVDSNYATIAWGIEFSFLEDNNY